MAHPDLFRPNGPAVISEVIDGEAVIINLDTGSYYSVTGTGAAVWRALELATPTAALLDVVSSGFEGVDPATAGTDLAAFLDHLVSESLIVPATTVAPVASRTPDAPADRPPYTAPVLEVFTDMQELILLDPVHDVDAAEGWPKAAVSAE